jgi:hypothetical protein
MEGCGMKSIIKMLLVSIICLARSAGADNVPTAKENPKVTISTEVQEHIQKLSPDMRKRMEAAIKVGNKYAPHHFDGTAYAMYDDNEKKMWRKNIRSLITPRVSWDGEEWYSSWQEIFIDSEPKPEPKLEINGVRVDLEVVCPWPELISASGVDDGIKLKYRTKIIGRWKSSYPKEYPIQGDILLDEKEEFDEVLITLDKNNRVSRIASKFEVVPTTPAFGIDHFESYIKWPPRAIFQGPNGADQETESEARAKIPQYKRFIELIKSEETAVCSGIPGNSNQKKVRE